MVRSWWSVLFLLGLLPAVRMVSANYAGTLSTGDSRAGILVQAQVGTPPCGAGLACPRALPALQRCPVDVAVLGGDLNASASAEVVAHLGAAPGVTLLRESLAGERSQAGGLIPPELLGITAVSSARLVRLPAGAGLTVRTDRNITLATAAMYADALVIAGVLHASVWVSAPVSAPALGTTALLGLLRAASTACISVASVRAGLAIRTLVLTSHVAQAYGAPAALALLHDALHAMDVGGLAAPVAVDKAISMAGTPLRPATRAALVALLSDLAAATAGEGGLRTLPVVQVASRYIATAGIPPPIPFRVGAALYRGTAVAAAGGTLTLVAAGTTRRLSHLPGQLVVTRNGLRAPLESILPGDAVTVRTDSGGHMTRLDAVGPTVVPPATVSSAGVSTGVIVAVDRLGLSYRVLGETTLRRVQGGSGLTVTRDGHQAALTALHPGDRVTVRTGSDGRPRTVQASSAATIGQPPVPAPATAHTPLLLRQGWPFALLVLLVVVGLLLIGVRSLPGMAPALPFALIERHPSLLQRDAATPATCDLARGARVLCPDGEVGPLIHTVVVPRTGALLRLVVRDRAETLREIPAHLIASAGPSAVRLTIPYAQLEEDLKRSGVFSARRYKRLAVQRRRPADDAPLLQTTADTLRVEVEGAPHF